MNTFTLKRKELINSRLKTIFWLFIVSSVLVVLFFLMEDYSLSIKKNLTDTSLMEENISLFSFSHFSENPLSLIVLALWGISSILFAFAFNTRLKPMFRVFFWISFSIVLLFNIWTNLISYAVHAQEASWLKTFIALKYSATSKALLLIFWGFFSIYISFTYVTTKYLGIFSRLDYLFHSILRGNWDANMFFRKGDPFCFLADSFNKLKNHYLTYLLKTDEFLIHLKDHISSSPFTPKLKNDLHELFEKDFLKENEK